MLAAGGVEPILPAVAHSAIIALTSFRLAGKFGDQPGAPKLRQGLWENYSIQLKAGLSALQIMNPKPPGAVTDWFDPERAERMEW